jgi:hypothetical protein
MTARWTEADYQQAMRKNHPGFQKARKVQTLDPQTLRANDRFPLFCELSGLPRPLCEVEGLVPGRKFRVDYLFREQRIVIERNGQIWKKGGHSSGKGLLRDYEKVNLLQLEGYRVFQFTPDQMLTAETIAILKQAMC